MHFVLWSQRVQVAQVSIVFCQTDDLHEVFYFLLMTALNVCGAQRFLMYLKCFCTHSYPRPFARKQSKASIALPLDCTKEGRVH